MLKSRKCLPVAVGLMFAAGATLVQADPLADPGTEQRQLERTDPGSFRPSPPIQFDLPAEPPMRAVADTPITVNDIQFRGNSVFSAAELAALVTDYRGNITFAQLVEATNRITMHYREAGYVVARAYIPEQPVNEGRVVIAVLEGALGAVHVQGEPPISDERVAAHMRRLARTGLINGADLEYGALLLNDLPGLSAGVSLRPGSEAGTSDVVLDVKNEGRYDISLDYNNFGSEVTGEHRFGAVIHANNLFGVGDRFTFRPIISDTGDTFYGSLGYEMPLFTVASRVGLRYSHLLSELGKPFDALEVENTASTLSAYGSHAFIRSRNRNLTGRLAFENRQFKREFGANIPGVTIEEADYTLNVIDLGLSGDYRDNFYGGGIASYSASVRVGLSDVTPEDGGSNVPGETRFDGKFTLLFLSGQRLQRLNDVWTANLRVDAQYSGDSLDTSEQIGLGGPQGVRAYRPAEALGDSGIVIQSELRRELPDLAARWDWLGRIEAYALLDMGATEVNSTLAVNARDSWTRNGAGLGLRLTGQRSFYIDLTVATRLADRESLVDQFGDDKTNFWAQAIYWF